MKKFLAVNARTDTHAKKKPEEKKNASPKADELKKEAAPTTN